MLSGWPLATGHWPLLFVPQRDHRINAGGAARGDVAGRQRDQRQQRDDRRVSQRVGGADAEQ